MSAVVLQQPAPARAVLPWRAFVVPLACIAAWLVVVDGGLVHHPLLVPLSRIVAAPFEDVAGREIWTALGVSLGRLAIGFSVGASLGIAVGIVAGLSGVFATVAAPTLHGLRQVTLFAWVPLLTGWFGNGETSKLVFIGLSAFFPCFLNTEQGLRAVPSKLREVGRVLKLSRRAHLLRLMLPGALPDIVIGLKIAWLSAWIGTVGAEYAIGSGVGLGAWLAGAREQFRMDLVLAGVATLAGVGAVSSLALDRILATLAPWRHRT